MNKVNEKVWIYIKNTGILVIICLACYLPLIANGYTNSMDGLWQTTQFQAGNWELSIGRWAWLFLDKIRGGYAAEPFNSLLTIVMLSFAMTILFADNVISKSNIVFSLQVLISTATACFLSYRYMSPTFGASVLLSVLAAKVLVVSNDSCTDKRIKISLFISSFILLTISLGMYQANIGCFCVIILFSSLLLLLNNETDKVCRLLVKSGMSFVISCIVYKILWDVAMKIRHVEPSWYQGANTLSISEMIMKIPNGVIKSYESFFYYYIFPDGYYVFMVIRIIILIGIVVSLIVIPFIKRINGISIICYELLVLITPVAACVSFLLAPAGGGLQAQMTAPLELAIPIALSLLLSSISNKLAIILGCVLLYGNIYAVGTDIDALAQGNTTSRQIMSSIANELLQNQLYAEDYKYAFVGEISKSPLFKVNDNWIRASYYARFGEIGTKPECVVNSYNGLIDDIGVNGLQVLWGEEYEQLLSEKKVKDMPCYPKEGAIEKEENIVIIKVSDNYEYNK